MNWLYSFKEKIELIVNCIRVIMKKNYVHSLVAHFLIFNTIYIYVYFVGIYLHAVYQLLSFFWLIFALFSLSVKRYCCFTVIWKT